MGTKMRCCDSCYNIITHSNKTVLKKLSNKKKQQNCQKSLERKESVQITQEKKDDINTEIIRHKTELKNQQLQIESENGKITILNNHDQERRKLSSQNVVMSSNAHIVVSKFSHPKVTDLHD